MLDEVDVACVSRLGDLIVLAHFGVFTFVKYLTLNPSPWPVTTPKRETFAKMGSPRTTSEPERETFARNDNGKNNNGRNNVHQSAQEGRQK